MTKTREIYRCPICGNIVEVLHEGAVLSCSCFRHFFGDKKLIA